MAARVPRLEEKAEAGLAERAAEELGLNEKRAGEERGPRRLGEAAAV